MFMLKKQGTFEYYYVFGNINSEQLVAEVKVVIEKIANKRKISTDDLEVLYLVQEVVERQKTFNKFYKPFIEFFLEYMFFMVMVKYIFMYFVEHIYVNVYGLIVIFIQISNFFKNIAIFLKKSVLLLLKKIMRFCFKFKKVKQIVLYGLKLINLLVYIVYGVICIILKFSDVIVYFFIIYTYIIYGICLLLQPIVKIRILKRVETLFNFCRFKLQVVLMNIFMSTLIQKNFILLSIIDYSLNNYLFVANIDSYKGKMSLFKYLQLVCKVLIVNSFIVLQNWFKLLGYEYKTIVYKHLYRTKFDFVLGQLFFPKDNTTFLKKKLEYYKELWQSIEYAFFYGFDSDAVIKPFFKEELYQKDRKYIKETSVLMAWITLAYYYYLQFALFCANTYDGYYFSTPLIYYKDYNEVYYDENEGFFEMGYFFHKLYPYIYFLKKEPEYTPFDNIRRDIPFEGTIGTMEHLLYKYSILGFYFRRWFKPMNSYYKFDFQKVRKVIFFSLLTSIYLFGFTRLLFDLPTEGILLFILVIFFTFILLPFVIFRIGIKNCKKVFYTEQEFQELVQNYIQKSTLVQWYVNFAFIFRGESMKVNKIKIGFIYSNFKIFCILVKNCGFLSAVKLCVYFKMYTEEKQNWWLGECNFISYIKKAGAEVPTMYVWIEDLYDSIHTDRYDFLHVDNKDNNKLYWKGYLNNKFIWDAYDKYFLITDEDDFFISHFEDLVDNEGVIDETVPLSLYFYDLNLQYQKITFNGVIIEGKVKIIRNLEKPKQVYFKVPFEYSKKFSLIGVFKEKEKVFEKIVYKKRTYKTAYHYLISWYLSLFLFYALFVPNFKDTKYGFYYPLSVLDLVSKMYWVLFHRWEICLMRFLKDKALLLDKFELRMKLPPRVKFERFDFPTNPNYIFINKYYFYLVWRYRLQEVQFEATIYRDIIESYRHSRSLFEFMYRPGRFYHGSKSRNVDFGYHDFFEELHDFVPSLFSDQKYLGAPRYYNGEDTWGISIDDDGEGADGVPLIEESLAEYSMRVYPDEEYPYGISSMERMINETDESEFDYEGKYTYGYNMYNLFDDNTFIPEIPYTLIDETKNPKLSELEEKFSYKIESLITYTPTVGGLPGNEAENCGNVLMGPLLLLIININLFCIIVGTSRVVQVYIVKAYKYAFGLTFMFLFYYIDYFGLEDTIIQFIWWWLQTEGMSLLPEVISNCIDTGVNYIYSYRESLNIYVDNFMDDSEGVWNEIFEVMVGVIEALLGIEIKM